VYKVGANGKRRVRRRVLDVRKKGVGIGSCSESALESDLVC
jgi:hypothetical protein